MFISWMVLVTLLSLFSFSGMDVPEMDVPNMDKAVHFVFYLGAALLGIFALRERTQGKISLLRTLGLVFFSVVIYGIIIEVLQSRFTEERTGDFFDVVANTTGALVGVAGIKMLYSGKRQLKWKN
jgi:VanZ family protein